MMWPKLSRSAGIGGGRRLPYIGDPGLASLRPCPREEPNSKKQRYARSPANKHNLGVLVQLWPQTRNSVLSLMEASLQWQQRKPGGEDGTTSSSPSSSSLAGNQARYKWFLATLWVNKHALICALMTKCLVQCGRATAACTEYHEMPPLLHGATLWCALRTRLSCGWGQALGL